IGGYIGGDNSRAGPARTKNITPGKQFGVAGGDLVALFQLVFKDAQLGQQDSGLEGVQAAIQADASVVIAAILAVVSNAPDLFGQFVVAGEHGAAIAVAAQGFAGEERGGGDVAQI